MKTSSLLAGFSLLAILAAGAAQAGPPAADPKVTGSVGLSNPLQYAEFEAFQSNPVKGHIAYTNFEFPAPGSGVWVPAKTSTITFNYFGPDYPHTFNLDSFTPLSTESVGFTGTGFYNPDHSYTWNLKGVINENQVWFQIVYTGTQAGCKLTANGTIGSNGSMSGTWSGDCWTGVNSWSTGAGSAYEVFSYKADVTCAVIAKPNATFGFTIPDGVPLAGTPVVVTVHDGGSPGALFDTWKHDVGTCSTEAVSQYPVVSGNLVVH